MIDVKVDVKDDTEKLKRLAKRWKFDALSGVAAFLRKTIQNSIRKRGKKNAPGAPGRPPKTGPEGLLKKSIVFDVDDSFGQWAIIGPTANVIDQIGKVHEFGGPFRGANYPARPFVRPALDKILPVVPKQFAAAFTTEG